MALIYGKTAKGLAEIETRAHRLMPRMRSALILADGKRDVDDLKTLVTHQADETLRALVEQGFIEAVGETVPPPVPAAPTAPVAGSDLDSTRRAAVRALTDSIGPAAEMMSMKIEKAKNLAELMPLLLQASQTIAAMRGRAAGEAFAKRFGVG